MQSWMRFSAASRPRWRNVLRSALSEDARRRDEEFQTMPVHVQQINHETHICGECAAEFGTAASLKAHFARTHTYSVARKYADGSVCKACLKRFDSRGHVLHHLAITKRKCLELLMVRCAPLTVEIAAELDEADCKQRKSARGSGRAPHRAYWPATQLQGPLLRALPVPTTPPGTPPPSESSND